MRSILGRISQPWELKKLSFYELRFLAEEIRDRIMDVLSTTGGHLSSNLGIVELTLALHYVFDSPRDKFIFDIGHQTYVHKLITGRNSCFPSLRQGGGLSGFSYPPESLHDHFYSGHAGNALSLSLGMAKNRDIQKKDAMILPILGDAALTCGLTLEAMNNVPRKIKKFLIILNDNAMSISKNVGAITNILSQVFNGSTANNNYRELIDIISKIPGYEKISSRQEDRITELIKNLTSTAPFFEQFGLSYVGPIDGHDIKKLIETLKGLKNIDRPTIVHVLTVKGQGMKNAINDPTPYHGAKPFNRSTGEFYPSKSTSPTFPKIFGNHLLKMADLDPTIVAITPAMPVGSCLDAFMKKYPSRCIDVGIAEGHAIAYAGGMGHEGKVKVIACVYSSFLQRAFDNIYHDVCIQNAPIVIAIDRGGLATGDGMTAQGLFDISYLNAMPGIVIAQPRNGHVLKELLESAFDYQKTIAIRYPNLVTYEEDSLVKKRDFGKGEVLAQGDEVVMISLGHMNEVALNARELLAKKRILATIVDPIFIKPLDETLLKSMIKDAELVITIEEHSLQGGLGSIINNFMMNHGLGRIPVKNFGIPDQLIEHGNYNTLLEKYKVTPEAIEEAVLAQLSIA